VAQQESLYARDVDDQTWSAALDDLARSADMFAVLSRCLAITPQLDAWREARTDLPGTDAANGLDQARGELERLSSGGAAALLQRVEAVLNELPTPWE
jgi:hypothetical protein